MFTRGRIGILLVVALLGAMIVPAAAQTIAFIQPGSFYYYDMSRAGAEAAARELGVRIIPFNSENDIAREIANVENAIARGVDGILLFSVSRSAQETAIRMAKAARVPIYLLYGYAPEFESDVVGFIQSDTILSGRLAGEWAAREVGTGKAAVIQGLLGRGDAEAYTDGFREGISGSGLTLVTAQPADWNRQLAYNTMQNIMTQHPDLAVVFVQNEDMAMGAIKALKDENRLGDVKVVAQNGSPEGLDAIGNGELAATVGWSPSQEGAIALVQLVDALRGGNNRRGLCITPMKVITKDNLDEAVPWEPTPETIAQAIAFRCE